MARSPSRGRTRGLVSLIAMSAIGLASCGGAGGTGGGGDTSSNSPPPPAAEFSLSTTSLSFVAKERFTAPPQQSVGATVNTTATGTLYILVKVTGQAVETVTGFEVTGTTSGAGFVVPADPANLTAGTYQSTVTVTACVNSPDCSSGQLRGSPQTVNVTYTVEPATVQGQLVMPRVAISNTTGDVIIRGVNFTGATGVSFGSTPAIAFSVISDSEIHASYPALAAGSYPVSINSGALAFSAALAVVDPQAYSATALPYPAPAPAAFAGMVGTPVYDAERKTIYVVLKAASAGANRLVSYTYANGAWGAPQQAAIADLRGVIVGPTGAYLLGYADDSILEIDPTTLVVENTYTVEDETNLPAQSTDPFIASLALANDGFVIATFGCSCSGFSPIYMFSTQDHSFQLVHTDNMLLPEELGTGYRQYPLITASADGATALIGSTYLYQPATSAMLRPAFTHDLTGDNAEPPVAMDNKGTRISLSATVDLGAYTGPEYVDIYDSQFQLLGRINEPTSTPGVGDVASAISPDVTRAYVLRVDFSQQVAVALLTYDITSATPVTSFPQVGTGIALAPMTMAYFDSPVATITPDGKTLLVGADNNLFVQPLQ